MLEILPEYLTRGPSEEASAQGLWGIVAMHADAMADAASAAQVEHLVKEWSIDLSEICLPVCLEQDKPLPPSSLGFKSVDDFLARSFTPSTRVIEGMNNSTVAISPCDGKVSAYQTVPEAAADFEARTQVPLSRLFDGLPHELANAFKAR